VNLDAGTMLARPGPPWVEEPAAPFCVRLHLIDKHAMAGNSQGFFGQHRTDVTYSKLARN